MISSVHSGLASGAIVELRKRIRIRANRKLKRSRWSMKFSASGESLRGSLAVMERIDKSDDERNQSHSSSPRKHGFESWSKATVCRVGKREGG
jgi:hypothetical protein